MSCEQQTCPDGRHRISLEKSPSSAKFLFQDSEVISALWVTAALRQDQKPGEQSLGLQQAFVFSEAGHLKFEQWVENILISLYFGTSFWSRGSDPSGITKQNFILNINPKNTNKKYTIFANCQLVCRPVTLYPVRSADLPSGSAKCTIAHEIVFLLYIQGIIYRPFNSAKQACHIITSIYHKITPLIGKGTILTASDISQTRRLVSTAICDTDCRMRIWGLVIWAIS